MENQINNIQIFFFEFGPLAEAGTSVLITKHRKVTFFFEFGSSFSSEVRYNFITCDDAVCVRV